MERIRVLGFVGGLLLLMAIVLGGTYLLANNYLAGHKEEKEVSICEKTGDTHTIVFKRDKTSPVNLEARFCDTLTITNESGKIRRIAFGQHEDHKAYDGIKEKYLQDGKSFRVTLNERGDFIVHDHLQEEVGSTFSVE